MIVSKLAHNEAYDLIKFKFSHIYAHTAQRNYAEHGTVKSSIEIINDEPCFCMTATWLSIDQFKESVALFANLATDELIECMNKDSAKRYLSVADTDGNIILSQQQVPNVKGQALIDWLDQQLATQ